MHRVEVNSRKEWCITNAPWGVSPLAPAISPDGSHLLFAAPVGAPRDRQLPYRVATPLWRLDGMGPLADSIADFFLMPIDGGASVRVCEAKAIPIACSWSRSGRSALVTDLTVGAEPRFRLHRLDLDKGSDSVIWESDFMVCSPVAEWTPDDRVVRSGPNTVGIGRPVDVFVTQASLEGNARLISRGITGWAFGILVADFPSEWALPRIVVSPDGGFAVVPVQSEGRLEPWKLAIADDVAPERIVGEDHATVALDASGDQLLVATSSMHEPPDLWLMRHDGSERRRLTRLNGVDFGPEKYFSVHALTATSRDGSEVAGWFLLPVGASMPAPTIVTCHGGPHASWGYSFSYDVCMLAAAGFATLLVNHRGSTGYSLEFAAGLHGDWGNHDADDVEAAIDFAISSGWIDRDRLAVRGVSAGGFLAAWLVTHTDRFCAAVLENPLLDLNAQLGSDFGMGSQLWIGDTMNDHDRLQMSPISAADRCRAPVLIIQHEEDWRVPTGGSDAFFERLLRAGCEAEMLRIPGSSHGGSIELGNPAVRVAENEALLDWILRHVPIPNDDALRETGTGYG